ncbi:glycosyltransferase [Acuticoccus sp. M5D2P5]|uniref:glycosyltransferase n=1 Tax=Acuticoccus kalidii TaxID=2910977 RepID=UPI001F359FDE|nr:glycosyltransferase [Acuticoccus kalidii]MCF3931929.1 glycosyltransferase [Acuticoccus kalidii]
MAASAPRDRARPRLALKPVSAPANAYSGLFSRHIDPAALDIVSFEWDGLGRGAYDVVVFHWPTEFFRPTRRKATLTLLAKMARDKWRHGTCFVWVAHNLEPHDGGSMRSALTSHLFTSLLDGVVYLSRSSREEARRLYPGLRFAKELVTVHGRYGAGTPPRPLRAAEWGNRVLFFGNIRGYKNVERLVEAARGVARAPFALTVIGTAGEAGLGEEIARRAAGDPRIAIDIRDAFVADEELERVIDAHDLVVLPYRNILNSGVALHALGRNKPILAPAIGSLPELREAVGADWVRLFDGDISTDVLEDALAAPLPSETAPDLTAYAWPKVGADISRFLTALADRGARPAL